MQTERQTPHFYSTQTERRTHTLKSCMIASFHACSDSTVVPQHYNSLLGPSMYYCVHCVEHVVSLYRCLTWRGRSHTRTSPIGMRNYGNTDQISLVSWLLTRSMVREFAVFVFFFALFFVCSFFVFCLFFFWFVFCLFSLFLLLYSICWFCCSCWLHV